MRPYQKNNEKRFYIRQRYGGPSIDFYTPIIAELKDGNVGPGLMSIYPFYYHYNEKFDSSKELKEAYASFNSYIQKMSKRIKIGKKIYLVGNYAIDQVKKGKLSFIDMSEFDWNTILI
jgi:hypothetical protein